MTDGYIKTVTDYTKSLLIVRKSFKNDFNSLVYLNALTNLTFDINKPLTKNDTEYVHKMNSTLKSLNGSIEDTKYNIFNDFVYRVINQYSKVGGNHYKLSKDALEFMNMLYKQDVPFLDGVL